MKGLAVSPAAPDVGAVLRSLLGVLVAAGLGLYLIGPAAALAAGAATAIAGATALQDSPHGRFPLVIGVSVTMGVAVLLGAATSVHWVLFAVVVGVWCFVAGMTWAAGSNAGLIAAASSALLVMAPPVQLAWTAACAAAGLAVLGGLAQAALIALWPRRRWRVQRAALARAYRSLAADARALADEPTGRVDTEPLADLRRAFTQTQSPSQAGRRPLSYRAWYGLPERIAVTLAALADRSSGADPVSRVMTAAAEVLDAVARPSRTSAKLVGPAMAGFDAAAAAVDGPEATLVTRLAAQLKDAAAIRFGESSPPNTTQLRRRGLSGTVARTITLAREQLVADSPVLRHAVRLGLAAGLGVVIARSADVAHGYWIPLTIVMVLRPETAHTYTRCVGRVAGNVVGVALATLVVAVLNPSGLVAAALAVAFLGAAYAVAAWGYLAVTAALAGAIVLLADTSGTAGLATMGDRVLATLIGGVLAVLAHVALPDRVAVRLRQRAGNSSRPRSTMPQR